MNILYTEDNAADADLAISHFQDVAPDFHFELARSAEECINKLRASCFDLVLLDQSLPDRQGLEVLALMRRMEQVPPVVMLTGSANEDHVIKALRLGAVEYIRKHGDYLEKMPELLRRVIERDQALKRSGLSLPSQNCELLYVEPSTMDVDLTIQHFSQEAPKFHFYPARTAEEALQLLKQGEPSFQAVVTDLRLPDMSGLELLRVAKQSGINIPFIIVTGKGDEEKAVAALKLGAYDYIVKRDNYLMQLASSVEHSIQRHQAEQRSIHLQIQLEETNRALQQANKDLDAFTHSVAHELRGPLRSMLSFAQITQEDLADKLSEEELHSLERITDNARKMTGLVDALLSFAKFSRQELKRENIEMRDLVLEAWNNLQEQRASRNIHFNLGPLPPVIGDRILLKQVLLNLLSNAIKFTRETAEARIDVTVTNGGDGPVFMIRDNGAGFEPEQGGRLFQPFERLHSPTQFEGTGIGLTLVQRIVERHHGRIWAEGTPGQGASFYFTLGKRTGSMEG